MTHAILWLAFGVLMAGAVLMGVQHHQHRTQAFFFYLAIVLLGPLVLLVALIPRNTLQDFAQRLRKKWDES